MDLATPPLTEDRPKRDVTQGIRRVVAVVNRASGGVEAGAETELRRILDTFDLQADVAAPEPGDILKALREAVDTGPDLLVVLAGDGTAGCAAETCGADGPPLIALPGGTMNMLPHALYGRRDWRSALTDSLDHGVLRTISGGEVDGHRFHCAAILGSPALWGPAREAVRAGDFTRAWRRAALAWRRSFSRRLRFRLDDQPEEKAVALSLICPLISRAVSDESALEAAALDHRDAAEVFRLAVNNLLGDWRRDPGVTTWACESGRAWAKGSVPCLVDGELHMLGPSVNIRFIPRAFRALAPEPSQDPPLSGPDA